MLVTIIARHLCTVNSNAIVLLTLHQKYHGLILLYQRRPYLRRYFNIEKNLTVLLTSNTVCAIIQLY